MDSPPSVAHSHGGNTHSSVANTLHGNYHGEYKNGKPCGQGTMTYANDNVYVYDSYDNYSIPIVVLQGVDYGDTINGIQLFDSGFSMSDTAIGTISINDTDYIKPTFEYDTDYDENRINTVGFGLRQLSMPDIM